MMVALEDPMRLIITRNTTAIISTSRTMLLLVDDVIFSGAWERVQLGMMNKGNMRRDEGDDERLFSNHFSFYAN